MIPTFANPAKKPFQSTLAPFTIEMINGTLTNNTIAINNVQAQLFGTLLPKDLTCLHVFTCHDGKGSGDGGGGTPGGKIGRDYWHQKTEGKEK